MSQSWRLLIVGGSTTRGHSISEEIVSYAYQVMRDFPMGSQIITKDLIQIREVKEILENSSDFDVWIIQVGVSDALLRKSNFEKKSNLPKIYPSKHPSIAKVILKWIGYYSGTRRAKTNASDFHSCIHSIANIAEVRQAKIIWLGSVIAPIRLTKFEIAIKNLYCKLYFRDLATRAPNSHAFIDVDDNCSQFVNRLDVFHLNQRGHDVLATLIKEKLDNWS